MVAEIVDLENLVGGIVGDLDEGSVSKKGVRAAHHNFPSTIRGMLATVPSRRASLMGFVWSLKMEDFTVHRRVKWGGKRTMSPMPYIGGRAESAGGASRSRGLGTACTRLPAPLFAAEGRVLSQMRQAMGEVLNMMTRTGEWRMTSVLAAMQKKDGEWERLLGRGGGSLRLWGVVGEWKGLPQGGGKVQ